MQKNILGHTLSSVCSLCVAVVAGPPSSSVLDDVTLPAEQSSKPRGKDTAQGNDNQTGRDSQSFVRMCNIYPDN